MALSNLEFKAFSVDRRTYVVIATGEDTVGTTHRFEVEGLALRFIREEKNGVGAEVEQAFPPVYGFLPYESPHRSVNVIVGEKEIAVPVSTNIDITIPFGS